MFIEDNVIKNTQVAEIDPGNAQLCKPIKDLYIGGKSHCDVCEQAFG